MRIKFLKDATYPQGDPKLSRSYKAGEEYDVADDHGQRWIRRNAAVEVVKVKAKPETVKADTLKFSESPAEIVTKGK